MLSFLAFISLWFTASLAASPFLTHGKEDFLKNHSLAQFHTKLQSSSEGSIITNTEQGSKFILVNNFANKDCGNSDGKQLFESLAMLSGFCMVSGSTSQRSTCDSSTVRVEEFNAADCEESHRSADTYVNAGQCYPTNFTNTQSLNKGVSYDCSTNYVPKGIWVTSMSFSDNACQNPLQGVSLLNGFCFSVDQKTSFQYDYPKEHIYSSSTDCTGKATSIDISTRMNSCHPLTSTFGSSNSYKYLLINH